MLSVVKDYAVVGATLRDINSDVDVALLDQLRHGSTTIVEDIPFDALSRIVEGTSSRFECGSQRPLPSRRQPGVRRWASTYRPIREWLAGSAAMTVMPLGES